MIIGICDDEKNVRALIGAYIRKLDDNSIIHYFEDGESVLKYIRQGKRIDLLYLDIDLKGFPDGMAVAGRIKEKQIKEGIGAYALPLIVLYRQRRRFYVHRKGIRTRVNATGNQRDAL